jgi:dihydropteroate synthase
MNNFFECGRFRFPLVGEKSKPLVMGILNVTPDSFSDGGYFTSLDGSISHAEQMIQDGVDIIDIGGESSRPGAQALTLDEELRRLMPVIYALRDCGKPLSIDTYKPEVMREAILAGADMINDIKGFQSIESINAVADANVGLCIMHMQSTPAEMQQKPQYDDVNKEVLNFLRDRVLECGKAGISKHRICIDPGFGFGKTLAHNMAMFQNISEYQLHLGLPLLAGVSRKSMIGEITGRPIDRRMAGSLAGALAALNHGAKLVRVHDVAETVDAIKVWQTLNL